MSLASSSQALRSQKRQLRRSVGAVLRTLDAANIAEQSNAVAARVLTLSAFRQCKNISCYLNMPSGELDTSPIVSEILTSGRSLFVPKIDLSVDGRMEFLRVYSSDDLDSLPGGTWGIREPTSEWDGKPRENASDVELDMILVPGVAFDRTLSRLGHGKGYYDRYISSYISSKCKRPRPLLVALSLSEQLVDTAVPTDSHDWKMDMIVTPNEVITTS